MSQADIDEAMLVPKPPLGSPEGEALASQDGKQEFPAQNSQAGAWELANISDHWQEVNLMDFCNPKQWKTISTSQLIETGYVVYGANGKIGFYNEYTHEKPTLMITCRGATCGNLHISDPFSYINGNAMALDELSDQVLQKYLFYALKARGLEDAISGSAQPQITRQGLAEVKVRLSSLAEQQEIAAKLDELLAQVDIIKTRLDTLPKILKRFRQSVLAAAVRGELTEEWRKENKTTDINELIQQVDKVKTGKLKIRNNQGWDKSLNFFDLPENWAWLQNYKLAEDKSTAICAGPFGTIFKAKDFRDEGIPIIFLRHVKEAGFQSK